MQTRCIACLAFLLPLSMTIAPMPSQSSVPDFEQDRRAPTLSELRQDYPTAKRTPSPSALSENFLAQLSDSKRRARLGDFDDAGTVLCSQERGEGLSACKASVARVKGSDATVVVTFSNGFARRLYFSKETFVRASTTMSGSGKDIDWSLEDGVFKIRVDDQRFEIPSDFVLGN